MFEIAMLQKTFSLALLLYTSTFTLPTRIQALYYLVPCMLPRYYIRCSYIQSSANHTHPSIIYVYYTAQGKLIPAGDIW